MAIVPEFRTSGGDRELGTFASGFGGNRHTYLVWYRSRYRRKLSFAHSTGSGELSLMMTRSAHPSVGFRRAVPFGVGTI